jgi:hypothetical protein
MENIINTFKMILCSYASSICVSLSKSMMFASLLVLRATHVGLGGWLLCSQQHEGKLLSRRLPAGIPLANRRSVREHYRCLILANTLTISALTVRQFPPVATEHDCREIPLRSVAINIHTIEDTACTLPALLGSTASSLPPPLSTRAGKHKSRKPRKWPPTYHLSDPDPSATSTDARHRCSEACGRHLTRRKEEGGQQAAALGLDGRFAGTSR